jgi:hypothetical protein
MCPNLRAHLGLLEFLECACQHIVHTPTLVTFAQCEYKLDRFVDRRLLAIFLQDGKL